MLSNLDAAAYDMWLILKEYNRVINVRKKIRCDCYTSFKIDASLFERWCFKTFCNMLSMNKEWVPDENLVGMIFGKQQFPEKCGISLLFNIGDKAGLSEHIKIQEIKHEKLGPVGFIMEFKGLKLFGSWVMREDLIGYVPKQFNEDGKNKNVLFHFRKMEYPEIKINLLFDWSGKYDNTKNKIIKYLRNNNNI